MKRNASRLLSLLSALLLIVALACLVLFPSMLLDHSYTDDFYLNISWIRAFSEAVFSGSPYPRWLPALWNGFGGADFFFYPPMLFWIVSLFKTVIRQDYGALIASAVFICSFSSCTFYLFCRHFFDKKTALFGAIFYIFVPYHLAIDWYERNAYAEFCSTLFIPLLLLGYVNLVTHKRRPILYVLSLAGLSLTHLPTTLVVVLFLAVVTVCFYVVRRREHPLPEMWRVLLWTGIGVGIGAFYWLPALALMPEVSSRFLAAGDNLNFMKWFFWDGQAEPNISLAALLKIQFLPYIFALIVLAFSLKKKYFLCNIFILAPVLFCLFLVTKVSLPLWWLLQPLQKIQFPWRSFVVLDFGLAFTLAALAAQRYKFISLKSLRVFVLVVCVGFVLAFDMQQALFYTHCDSFLIHQYKKHMIGALEYLPQEIVQKFTDDDIEITSPFSVYLPLLKLRYNQELMLESENIYLKYTYRSPRHIIMQINAPRPLDVPIKLLYWKYWSATNMDTHQAVPAFSCDGLLCLHVDAPESRISLILPPQPSERAGQWCSVLCLAVAAFFGTRSNRAGSKAPCV